jgi:hypothetical protein
MADAVIPRVALVQNDVIEVHEFGNGGVPPRVGQASRLSPFSEASRTQNGFDIIQPSPAPEGGVPEVGDRRDACPTTSVRIEPKEEMPPGRL